MSIKGTFVKDSKFVNGELKISVKVEGNTEDYKVTTKTNLKNPSADLGDLIDAMNKAKGDIDYLVAKLPSPEMSEDEANDLADKVEQQKSEELGSKEAVINA